MSHPCAACGGSGYSRYRYENGVRVELSLAEAHEQPDSTYESDCPVCLGAGRISDRMPARDAVADAATLRQNVDTYDKPQQNREYRTALWLNHASLNGQRARRHAPQYLDRDKTVNAARAAFRAVPGLREDK